ncbi:putative tetratricopeptide-like helical domain superfamily [Helianthus annuus]|nr:putative tetratricopeptide-like helical domain superfamily [Helianthus annuus]KAJ0695627.1 putative tetratricopeptide-like helical domain superfamily [Helianthus annuus]
MSFRRTPHSFPQPSTSSASKNATKLSSLLQKSIPKPPQPPITFKPPTTNPLHCFDYMILLQPIPPISQFNQLLNSVPNPQLKIILFRKINNTHLPISPNFITLNIVLNCYCHLNEVGFAFGVFGLILKKGFLPDSVSYTSLIKGLLKKNQIFEAVRLFRKMVLLGNVSYTNVSYTYGALISGLCRAGDIDTAIRFHEDVVNGKMGCLGFVCKPSGVCYSVLIDNLCKNGRVSKAKELFMEMRMRRISPDVVAFSSLIRGLCFMDLREAKRLFVEMVNEGVRPSVTVFNLLVHVLCKDRRLNEASGLFEFMVRKGEKLDSLSYNTLMHGYCLEGKIEEAKELYVSMVAKGIEPDVQIHNVLIDGYIKVRRVEEALRIFKQMVRGTIKPNVVTYNVLLTGVLQKGDALDLLQALESNGTELGIKVYNSVIDGLCKSGRMETAYDIYTKLSSKGLKPTVVTYTIMIHGFCKTGQVKKADSLFFEMIENKCAPNVVTFNAFMRKGSNMGPKVVELVKKAVERKVTPDASTLSLMVDLLSKDEKYKKYLDTLRTFLEVG